MAKWREQVAAEFRQLPGILGKLVGGATVAIGTLGIVLGDKHHSRTSIALGLIALGAGLLLFFVSARWLQARKGDVAQAAGGAGDQRRMSVVAWTLLACVVLAFLLVVQLLTGN